ncbi:MAG TPA: tartrate dehydrogenase [Chloroflexota bacterium]|nr:tartrate dehydrogenase [Chloroflexota bacterium]
MNRYRVAVIAGDGVGKEVIHAGKRVLEAAARCDGGFALDWEDLPWGSAHYLATGRMMPDDGLTLLRASDAIYLGAVGWPDIPDHITLWGLLLPIRQRFDLYANLRPVKLLPGVPCPLVGKEPADIDMLCVRENSEGEYSGAGGRVHLGFGHEVAIQTDVFTRTGIEKVVRHAFHQARRRRGHLTSITKSNASPFAFVLWDEVVGAVAADYPDVRVDKMLVDAAAARFITAPETFDVVVASNLFGDILTDIGAVIQGSMGLAASANINPDGGYPGLFEPVHGSAPDIAGNGIANPIGAIWAGALMLEHLGEPSAAAAALDAIAQVLATSDVRTRDLGGSASTEEVTCAIISALE